jgi:hypothetical protein
VGRKEKHAGFGWGILKESDHLEDLEMDGRIILKCILRQVDGRMWTGCTWLRRDTSAGLL